MAIYYKGNELGNMIFAEAANKANKTYNLFFSKDIDDNATGYITIQNIDTTDDICIFFDIPAKEDAQTDDKLRVDFYTPGANTNENFVHLIDTAVFATTEKAYCYEMTRLGLSYKIYKTPLIIGAQSNYSLNNSTSTLVTFHDKEIVFGNKSSPYMVKSIKISRIGTNAQMFPKGTKIRIFKKF